MLYWGRFTYTTLKGHTLAYGSTRVVVKPRKSLCGFYSIGRNTMEDAGVSKVEREEYRSWFMSFAHVENERVTGYVSSVVPVLASRTPGEVYAFARKMAEQYEKNIQAPDRNIEVQLVSLNQM